MAKLFQKSILGCILNMLALPMATVLLYGCTGHGRAHKDSDDRKQEIERTSEIHSRHAAHPLDLKLYMERSGSMVSFDSEQSKGQLKGIVSTLLNRFPQVNSNDSTSVYIVNDNIYPYAGSVKDFLAQRDFFSSTKDVGDPSYTAFDRIFEMILADTKKYQVSALVTDLIYSVRGQEAVSASKLLNEAYSLTHNVFKGHTNTSVLVIKFKADYNGPYYPFNSPMTGIQYSGDRPFYVLIFVSKDSMEELYGTVEYKAFTNFSTLSGFENMFCFTDMQFSPEYSVVKDYKHEGRFRKDRDGDTTEKSGLIKAIKDAQLSKEGTITIPIAMDLSRIPLSNNYKENKDYYEITSDAGFKVKSIEAINEIDNVSTVTHILPTATHLLMLESTERPRNEQVDIKLAYKFPSWITRTSCSDDSNLKDDSFDDTTFGFEEVMKGIYGAYVPDGSIHFLFNISIDIKKK